MLECQLSEEIYMNSKTMENFDAAHASDLSFYELTLQTHDFYEFYLFKKSNIYMILSGTSYKISAGDLVLIPPGISHRLTPEAHPISCEYFTFHISADYCAHLRSISPCYLYIIDQFLLQNICYFHFDFMNFSVLQSKLQQLIKEINTDQFGRVPKIILCAEDLLLQINREYYSANHKINQDSIDSTTEALLQIINDNIEKDISLDYLASCLYMSKYHISHLFKKRFGLSIHQYIIKQRLTLCMDSYLKGTPLSKTHERYGFKDYSSFYRAFVKEYGMSPQEYKKIQKKK